MTRHEQTDLDPKYVLYFAVALVVVGIVIFFGVAWMFFQFENQQTLHEPPPSAVQVITPVPEPRLQINPQGDLEDLRRQEMEILSSYRWIDRDKGTARIPIDRAMQIFVEMQQK
jgi:hypothetical protein